ncbi:MAG: acyl-CoA thioesterase [Deltaproteobacteria bacterium]|nr:acyl-CoA thioesterase [Deltaproteobacteria bacterium]
MEKNKRFTINLNIRFRDLDAIGHVNNSNYLTFMEEARKEFFGHLFKISSPHDFPFVLARIACDFRKSIEPDTKIVAVDLWITHIGRKSFSFKYEIYHAQDPSDIFASGESVQVFYDHKSNQTVEISDKFKEKFKKYLI